jgi:hypothetical protein
VKKKTRREESREEVEEGKREVMKLRGLPPEEREFVAKL